MEKAERQYLGAAAKAQDWDVRATARASGITRDTRYRKIKKYNLASEE